MELDSLLSFGQQLDASITTKRRDVNKEIYALKLKQNGIHRWISDELDKIESGCRLELSRVKQAAIGKFNAEIVFTLERITNIITVSFSIYLSLSKNAGKINF